MPILRPPLALPVLLVLLLVATPAQARAGELVLEAGWYSIVRPYRYDEARRFEGGWNRGADVLVAGERVRSPVDGRVRFAGRVAGRAVVTIEARLDGEAVVVTLTGLRAIQVTDGQRVMAGEVVGRGSALHVGAYDASRRTRYLPVRASGAPEAARIPPPAPLAAAPVPARTSLSGSIAERLRAAILGDVVGSARRWRGQGAPRGREQLRAPHSLAVATGSRDGFQFPREHRGDSGNREWWRQPMLLSSRPQRGSEIPRAQRGSEMPRASAGPAIVNFRPQSGDRVTFSQVRTPDAAAAAARGPAPGAVSAAWAEKSADRQAASIEQIARAVVSVGAGGSGDPGEPVTGGRPEPGPGVRHARELSPPQRIAPASMAQTATDFEQVQSPPAGSGRWGSAGDITTVAAAIAALPILAAWWGRRRRRPRTRAPRPVHQPLPIVLPHVRPYAYPVVRSDGSSVLPDIALAWPGLETGTTCDTDPSRCPRARAPEHA